MDRSRWIAERVDGRIDDSQNVCSHVHPVTPNVHEQIMVELYTFVPHTARMCPNLEEKQLEDVRLSVLSTQCLVFISIHISKMVVFKLVLYRGNNM